MELIQKHALTNILANKTLQLALIYTSAFLVPFILKQPQIIIGAIINFILITAVSSFEIKQILPLLFLPSISTLLNGVIFGTFTPYLIYLIPLIAVANLIYVLSYKYIHFKYANVFLASILKACFLFSVVYILFNTIHIPEIFLTTMGTIQLYTALLGGIFAQVLLNLKKK